MVVTDTLEHSSCNSSQVMEIVSFHQEKDAKQEFTLPHKRKNTKSNAMRSVSHYITSFNKISENCQKETFSSGENYNFSTSRP